MEPKQKMEFSEEALRDIVLQSLSVKPEFFNTFEAFFYLTEDGKPMFVLEKQEAHEIYKKNTIKFSSIVFWSR